MANPAPKIINFNFSYLIVSVHRPSHTCASFLCRFFRVSMFVTGLFCQRHCSHDSPADVVFSFFPRCSVPLCVVQCGACVFCVCVSVIVSVCECECACECVCVCVCVWSWACVRVSVCVFCRFWCAASCFQR